MAHGQLDHGLEARPGFGVVGYAGGAAIAAYVGVEGGAFAEEGFAGGAYDCVGEQEAHASEFLDPAGDAEFVVVVGGLFVAGLEFEDGHLDAH